MMKKKITPTLIKSGEKTYDLVFLSNEKPKNEEKKDDIHRINCVHCGKKKGMAEVSDRVFLCTTCGADLWV